MEIPITLVVGCIKCGGNRMTLIDTIDILLCRECNTKVSLSLEGNEDKQWLTIDATCINCDTGMEPMQKWEYQCRKCNALIGVSIDIPQGSRVPRNTRVRN